MQSKRYRISGLDNQGDLHSVETESAERALAVLTQFRENLEGAKLEDTKRDADELSSDEQRAR